MGDGRESAGSGNVFADLGLPDPDLALVKADLAIKIGAAMTAKGWESAQAAQFLGLSEDQVSGLIRGRLNEFTADDLIQYLNRLDVDVEINVEPNVSAFRAAHTVVRGRVAPMAASSRSGRQETMKFD